MRKPSPVSVFVRTKFAENPQFTNKELYEAAKAAGYETNLQTIGGMNYYIKNYEKFKKYGKKYRKAKKNTKTHVVVKNQPLVSLNNDESTKFVRVVANLGLVRSQQLLKEFAKKIGV
jgi:hypothetical protein